VLADKLIVVESSSSLKVFDMGKCILCGRESVTISNSIGICVNCIREKWSSAYPILRERHRALRESIGLVPETPRSLSGFTCTMCGRGCSLNVGDRGYCSFRLYSERGFSLTTGDVWTAIGLYYYDPHPTNCVAFPVCPAITGRGYPRYALTPRGERGYYNIAVFMGGCNLNCLYCQNWEYRLMTVRKNPKLTVEDLVKAVNSRTTCVCFFGGDPGPWSHFVLEASRKMLTEAEAKKLRVFRICWETNGLWNPILFKKAVEYSLETGGIVKVDLKAWSPEVYYALTGVESAHVEIIKKNIAYAASLFSDRREPPLLVVSTLVVPGYVDEAEIDGITRFLAELNPEIPYVLLAFHPDYELRDLPRTSYSHMKKAVEIAKKNGLKNVYIGNEWLLSFEY